jgi:hypothetical protein
MIGVTAENPPFSRKLRSDIFQTAIISFTDISSNPEDYVYNSIYQYDSVTLQLIQKEDSCRKEHPVWLFSRLPSWRKLWGVLFP